jgi:hypothetical protein
MQESGSCKINNVVWKINSPPIQLYNYAAFSKSEYLIFYSINTALINSKLKNSQLIIIQKHTVGSVDPKIEKAET